MRSGPPLLEWDWGLNKGRVYSSYCLFSLPPNLVGRGDVTLAGWGPLLCQVRG